MPDILPWNQLSSATALVLFCDLQKEIVKHSKTTSPRALASSAGALLQLAKLFALPTVVSVVPEGPNPPKLIAELEDSADFAPEMLRTTVSLFGDYSTEQAIARSNRKVLIVAGFMLEAVVLATVLDACARSFEVLVPVDACGSPSARTEQAALHQMEAAGAITASVISIGTKLSPDLATDLGKQMFGIVSGIKVD